MSFFPGNRNFQSVYINNKLDGCPWNFAKPIWRGLTWLICLFCFSRIFNRFCYLVHCISSCWSVWSEHGRANCLILTTWAIPSQKTGWLVAILNIASDMFTIRGSQCLWEPISAVGEWGVQLGRQWIVRTLKKLGFSESINSKAGSLLEDPTLASFELCNFHPNSDILKYGSPSSFRLYK